MRVMVKLLFSQRPPSGVFQAIGQDSLVSLKQASEANDYQYLELDGTKINDKVGILNTLEDALKPPLPLNG